MSSEEFYSDEEHSSEEEDSEEEDDVEHKDTDEEEDEDDEGEEEEDEDEEEEEEDDDDDEGYIESGDEGNAGNGNYNIFSLFGQSAASSNVSVSQSGVGFSMGSQPQGFSSSSSQPQGFSSSSSQPQGFSSSSSQPQGFSSSSSQPQGFSSSSTFQQPQGFSSSSTFQQPQGFSSSSTFQQPPSLQGFSQPGVSSSNPLDVMTQSPFVVPIIKDPSLKGNIDEDLKPFGGESSEDFSTRQTITKAISGPPYNLSVRDALIAGRLWCLKARYPGTTFSPEVERELERISSLNK